MRPATAVVQACVFAPMLVLALVSMPLAAQLAVFLAWVGLSYWALSGRLWRWDAKLAAKRVRQGR